MKIAIKHGLLRSLRESRNVPIEAMLRKLSISQEEYKKFENEDFEVDQDYADRIASILGYNWSVFLLERQPVFKKNVDNRTLENKTTHLSKKTILAIEDANFILSFYSGLPNKQGLKLPKFEDIENTVACFRDVRWSEREICMKHLAELNRLSDRVRGLLGKSSTELK